MNVAAFDKRYVADFLTFLENRISLVSEDSELCDLIQSIGMLSISTVSIDEPKLTFLATDGNATRTDGLDASNFSNVRTEAAKVAGIDINEACGRVLALLAARSADMVTDLRTDSLRKILTVFSLLPFQHDGLVDAIESEVETRRALLESSDESSVESLLEQASSSAKAVERILLGAADDSQTTRLAALRHGLKALFTHSVDDEGEDDEHRQALETIESSVGDELGHQIKLMLQSVADASTEVEKLKKSCHISIDSSIKTTEYNVIFELGRCSELIEHYRRVDFKSGARQSRFDHERRRGMAKRVLSRHLP